MLARVAAAARPRFTRTFTRARLAASLPALLPLHRMASSCCGGSVAQHLVSPDKASTLLSVDCHSGKVAADPAAITVVIYHANCTDGFGAAFAAWKRVPGARFIPLAHGPSKALPEGLEGQHVAVADFCFSAADTQKLIDTAASVIILDHHASARDDLASVSSAYKVFEMGASGASLAWQYFHPGTEVPLFLRYVEDKDIWRWALKDSEEFTAGLGTVPETFEAWDALLAGGEAAVAEVIAKGRAIVEYKRSVVERHVAQAVPCVLAAAPTFRGMCVNGTTLSSEIGNALAKLPGVDYGLIWTYEHDAKVWRVSLRSNSDEVDVAAMAKSFGGGGHRRAAGFSYKGAHINDLLQ